MEIHQALKNQLSSYVKNSKIPNILLYGNSGSGKRTLVKWFLELIYKKEEIKDYTLSVDCARGKGIKFIRDELKFFAKTNIHYSENKHLFKTIILYNADKLTIDAQSALRRCIELFSHTTRFILVVEDKFKLLNPIISRFCEIYVPYPMIKNKEVNLHKINSVTKTIQKSKETYLKKKLKDFSPIKKIELIDLTDKLYNKGYSVFDFIHFIEQSKDIENDNRVSLLVSINKISKEIKSEKLIIFFVLDLLFFRSTVNLENIMNI